MLGQGWRQLVELHQPVLAREAAEVADELDDEKSTGHQVGDGDWITLGGDDGEVSGHGECGARHGRDGRRPRGHVR